MTVKAPLGMTWSRAIVTYCTEESAAVFTL
jgi:hypothetical protein